MLLVYYISVDSILVVIESTDESTVKWELLTKTHHLLFFVYLILLTITYF